MLHDRRSSTLQPPHVGPESTQRDADRPRWWTLGLLCVAQFMLVLDVTVVNVALPDLARDLDLVGASAGWAVTAYALPFAGLLLLGGRIADLVGPRRTVLAGLVLFTAASLAAGLAGSEAVFLTARGAQGVGAALLSPAALATVTRLFDGPDRARALAAWGAVGGSGAAVGVLVGGLLVAGPGWRSIFLINVPIGILVAVALTLVTRVFTGLPAGTHGAAGRRLDVLGAVLALVGVAALVRGLTLSAGPQRSSVGVVLALGGVAVLALFWWRERAAAAPLLDPALVRRPAVRGGALVMLGATAVLVGSFFLLSFLLQARLGWSALTTGLAFLPVAVAVGAGAHLGGRLVVRLGGRTVAAAGLGAAALGSAVSALSGDTVALVVGGTTVAALGLGSAFVAATTTAMTQVEESRAGVTSGVVSTAHELGAAIGVAVLSSVAASSLLAPDMLGGFSRGFAVAAVIAAATSVAAALLVPAVRPTADAPRFAH
ncbi:MFS transporter [Cellulomonas sp.]|uniref:MFS transporter n=1 Tax=Cellulomonas sp. TaxID=40001 RepID=UPI001B0A0B7C|nr:MFS transporter [Cellulomonas sp.]MBO9553680.1 MFS transporter [Cellulomonas sp.]